MITLENHQLYYREDCPFCQKVISALESKGIFLELRSTLDLANREEMIRIGGKRQVPCLVIDGKALYESDAIIEYLEKKAAEQA